MLTEGQILWAIVILLVILVVYYYVYHGEEEGLWVPPDGGCYNNILGEHEVAQAKRITNSKMDVDTEGGPWQNIMQDMALEPSVKASQKKFIADKKFYSKGASTLPTRSDVTTVNGYRGLRRPIGGTRIVDSGARQIPSECGVDRRHHGIDLHWGRWRNKYTGDAH